MSTGELHSAILPNLHWLDVLIGTGQTDWGQFMPDIEAKEITVCPIELMLQTSLTSLE